MPEEFKKNFIKEEVVSWSSNNILAVMWKDRKNVIVLSTWLDFWFTKFRKGKGKKIYKLKIYLYEFMVLGVRKNCYFIRYNI